MERLRESVADRYAIEQELGAGGMATVYLARDLRHHRKVAVKVLHPHLAANLGRERFLREVTIAANLQHPHILPVFDSGEVGDLLYYVMPLVEGESLRSRMAGVGLLPVPEAVHILRDVADAMAAAHAKGVIHRDIKPENIMLSGRHALVTDFGVARAVAGAQGGGIGQEPLTTAGVALGTPFYMAPEQVVADPATDHRADIYSFGVLAYELLAGRRPFDGLSMQAILVAHLMTPPEPIANHRQGVPAALSALVMRCLAKDAADRWQSAEGMALELEAILTASGPSSVRTVPTRRLRRRRALVGAAAILALVATGLPLGIGMLRRAASDGIGSWMALAHPVRLTSHGRVFVADLSPDGQMLAYVSADQGGNTLWVDDLQGGSKIRIAAVGDPTELRWSPDGSSLLYSGSDSTNQDAQAVVYPRLGGAPRSFPVGGAAIWSGDGSKLASWPWYAAGADSATVLTLQTGERHTVPLAEAFGIRGSGDWSPDGSWLVMTTWRPTPAPRSSLLILDPRDGATVSLLDDSVPLASPRWIADGKGVVFLKGNDVWGLGVDRKGHRHGAPRLLRSGLQATRLSPGRGGEAIAYVRVDGRRNLWMVPGGNAGERIDGRDAAPVELTRGSAIVDGVPSPDGDQVAYVEFGGRGGNLFLVPTTGGDPVALTSKYEVQSPPAWSPDGRAVAFVATVASGRRIRVLRLQDRTEITFDNTDIAGNVTWQAGQRELVWAPGQRIIYRRSGVGVYRVLDPATGREEPLVTTDTLAPMFSPVSSGDGQAVAVRWLRPPLGGIWLISLRDSSHVQLSTADYLPIGWSEDEQWVHARTLDGKQAITMAADGSGRTRPLNLPADREYEGCTPFRRRGTQRFLCGISEWIFDAWLIQDSTADGVPARGR